MRVIYQILLALSPLIIVISLGYQPLVYLLFPAPVSGRSGPQRKMDKSFAVMASILSILWAGVCSISLFIYEGRAFSNPVRVAVVVFALCFLRACVVMFSIFEEARLSKNFREIFSINRLDKNMEIIRIQNGTKVTPHNVVSVPDGLDLYCTSGLEEAYLHPELEIVLKLEDGAAEKLLIKLINRISSGEEFEDGQTIKGLVSTDIRLLQVLPEDGNSPCLRLLFPDSNGRWPDDNKCNPIVAQQILPYNQLWSFSDTFTTETGDSYK